MTLTCAYFAHSFQHLPPQVKLCLFCLLTLGLFEGCMSFALPAIDVAHHAAIVTSLGFAAIGILLCTAVIAFFSEHGTIPIPDKEAYVPIVTPPVG